MIILFTVVWLVEERFLSPPGWQRPLGQLAAGEYDVERVIDGDTIVLASNQLRVRLQGIDTPETVKPNAQVEAWGDEASAYTTKFVADAGWRVRLEIDGEPVDRYGRHLAFVWSGTRLLNEELVARGLARAKTNFDFSQGLKQRLRRAQADASNSERGLWRPQTADE
ncbi:MAG: thermonuclease family protein [Planctomycetota bacterium]